MEIEDLVIVYENFRLGAEDDIPLLFAFSLICSFFSTLPSTILILSNPQSSSTRNYSRICQNINQPTAHAFPSLPKCWSTLHFTMKIYLVKISPTSSNDFSKNPYQDLGKLSKSIYQQTATITTTPTNGVLLDQTKKIHSSNMCEFHIIPSTISIFFHSITLNNINRLISNLCSRKCVLRIF